MRKFEGAILKITIQQSLSSFIVQFCFRSSRNRLSILKTRLSVRRNVFAVHHERITTVQLLKIRNRFYARRNELRKKIIRFRKMFE